MTKGLGEEAMHAVYYSVNTWLAYLVGQQFYGGYHHVWCSPIFDHRSLAIVERTTPPSSSPAEIYFQLYEDVQNKDHHSSKIAANRLGLIRGAGIRRKEGKITAAEYRDIVGIVDQAVISDFRPLLFVIPAAGVKNRLKRPPLADRAHPLSLEYVIHKLPRTFFDVIEIWR